MGGVLNKSKKSSPDSTSESATEPVKGGLDSEPHEAPILIQNAPGQRNQFSSCFPAVENKAKNVKICGPRMDCTMQVCNSSITVADNLHRLTILGHKNKVNVEGSHVTIRILGYQNSVEQNGDNTTIIFDEGGVGIVNSSKKSLTLIPYHLPDRDYGVDIPPLFELPPPFPGLSKSEGKQGDDGAIPMAVFMYTCYSPLEEEIPESGSLEKTDNEALGENELRILFAPPANQEDDGQESPLAGPSPNNRFKRGATEMDSCEDEDIPWKRAKPSFLSIKIN